MNAAAGQWLAAALLLGCAPGLRAASAQEATPRPTPSAPSSATPATPASPATPAPATLAPATPAPLAVPAPGAPAPDAPGGRVLFSDSHPPPAERQSSSSSGQSEPGPPDTLPATPVTREERTAARITSWDLDVHLVPSESRETVRAQVEVRNSGAVPLERVVLEISSTLRFQSVTAAGASGGVIAVRFTQSPVATDTDHTGYAEEAVLVPQRPLLPGGVATFSVLYGGTIPQSDARLELAGVPAERAEATDWDRIAPTTDAGATALRGFGHVLWYPVTAPEARLGDGNQLFEAIGRQELAEEDATMRLRLTVEYEGDPPEGAIFNGELQPLTKIPDDPDETVEHSRGVATIDFPPRRLGFRTASLFLTAQKPVTTEGQELAAITADTDAVTPYADAARKVRPLEEDWFGVTPLRPLLLLDHPGEPFEDGALLVGQLAADAEPARTADLLAGPLTHAWIQSQHPWIADGLARFMGLLWTERVHGRTAALAELGVDGRTLAIADPGAGAGAEGQPLVGASSEVFYRIKAAAVWWQLREILGEDPLRQGLVAYRHAESANDAFDRDPAAMQKTLERVSGKDLGWFFDDWVYHDRGLPDLSVVQVNSHALPEKGGRSPGYLVAVEVRNAGDAAAEVPVVVSSGSLAATERLRVGARSVAAVRILFEGTPERVTVNDGSVPEIAQTTHVDQIRTVPDERPAQAP